MESQDRTKILEGEEGAWALALGARLVRQVRDVIEEVVAVELEDMLGATAWRRTPSRVGYRHGRKTRAVATAAGPVELTLPRGRLFGPDGTTREWASRILPRYQRRAPDVNAAVLGCYLGGVNTRKVKRVLRPLLRGAPLSRSAVSRLVDRLRARFQAWAARDLAAEPFPYLFADGFMVPIRLGGKVVTVPVLAILGVRPSGERVLVALERVTSESAAAWGELVRNLVGRGLRAPILTVIDGSPGLAKALAEAWPKARIQRCTVHKGRNLQAKAPRHLQPEVAAEYRAFLDAETPEAVHAGYERFLRKWDRVCPAVATSLREAGEALLTFTEFPRSQWKSLRTTNRLERLNEEFRRRVKTQGGFPTEDAVLVLLFGLVDSGLVRLRKMDGWADLPEVLLKFGRQAA